MDVVLVSTPRFIANPASLDDPWIPGALYSSYDWRANKALVPAKAGCPVSS